MKLDPGKILHRAEQRLGELSQADGEETLRLLRSFLRMESQRLRMLHRYGLGGMEMARARSQVVDALIAHLYRLAMERYQTRPPTNRRDRAELQRRRQQSPSLGERRLEHLHPLLRIRGAAHCRHEEYR